MNILFYVFIALVIVLLNEYRLIKKYIRAHNNNFEKTAIQKVTLFFIKALLVLTYWVDKKLLNNELNY